MKLIEVKDNRAKINIDAANYLIGDERGSTIMGIRQLIAYIYNSNTYSAPDLFRLMRNADRDHAEMITSIVDLCGNQYGDLSFFLINELAPRVIEKFGDKLEAVR